MRLVIATRDGIQAVRWIRGERSGRTEAIALKGDEVRAIAQGRSSIFAAARASGVFRSMDRGETWQRVAPGTPAHEAVTLAATPRGPELLYLGVEPAALYVSRDGGAEWVELPSFRALAERPSERWEGYGARAAHVQSVACDPHAAPFLYVGVEIGGAYRSGDGGASWEPINEGLYDDIHRLAVDPRDGSRLYAATGGGLHISRDRGASWSRAEGEPGGLYCTDLLVPASSGRTTLYVATAEGYPSSWTGRRADARARLWASRDAGESWMPADGGPKPRGKAGYLALADDPAREEAIFVATGEGALYHVDDGGARWTRMLFGLPAVSGLVVV